VRCKKAKPMKHYRQLRTLVQRLRRKNRTAGSSAADYEVFTQDGSYQRVSAANRAATLADTTAQQHPGQTVHVWGPGEQHLYCCTAEQEPQAQQRRAGFDTDASIAIELVMWVNNQQVPYRQLQAVIKNMTRKMAANRYDTEQAVKGFMYAAESGAKDYAAEFGGQWHEMFPKSVRLMAAEMLRDEFEAEVDLNPQDYGQHVHKKHLPEWEKRYSQAASTRAAATTTDQLLTDVTHQLDWNPHAALDLALQVLSIAGHGDDAVDALDLEAQHQDPDYRQQPVNPDIQDAVLAVVGADLDAVAQFAVDLLQEVNWSKMARTVREYFFGPDQQRYPDPYQGPVADNQRDTAVATTQETVMTQNRPPSRRRRQRLANRVERARSRETDRDRNDSRSRRAQRTITREERLKLRVASLTGLLRTAERELQRAEDDQQDLQNRRGRVADIRETLDRQQRPTRRTAARRRRAASRQRRPVQRLSLIHI